ncbi:RHS repeat-associated core domain-containing protein [Chitinolyticbacter albus]|uniref:RHS repeat-associated core domain-containing protein n=1 Tax=Chitinolyticbacter albus TaxID=2961951 RepID=UPI002109AD34|nr:RHS repeat-associated core domain-containing protein [Chitinolyticbacter albus]
MVMTYGATRPDDTTSSSSSYTANMQESQRIMRQYAVVPLNAQLAKDVQASINGFDKWIRDLTGGKLTLADLETVLSAVPVVGNLIAAADVITGLYEISQKQDEVSLVDWFGIGIDTIGIVPVPPGLAATRIAFRPVVGVVKQALVRNAGDIGEAVLSVVVNHLMTDLKLADKVEAAASDFAKQLKPALDGCVDFLSKLIDQFAAFLQQLAKGELGKYRVTKSTRYQKGRNFRSPEQEEKGFFSTLLSFHASAQMAAINSIIKLALPDRLRDELLGIANYLLTSIKSQISSRILALGNAAAKGSIAWLLKELVARLTKRKGQHRANGAATSNQSGKVEYRVPNAATEKQRKLQPVQRSPNACKICPHSNTSSVSGKTKRSINLGLGFESFSHTDFILPGVIPLIWTRTYNSRLASQDQGSLGARWLTPYHTQFAIHDDKLVYTDAQGRELDYPLLGVGEHHIDRSEGLTISALDERLLSVTRGHELLELYERHGQRYALALLRDRAGNQIALDYGSNGHLSRLRNGDGPWVHIATDQAGRITQLSLSADGPEAPARILAQYRYDDRGDLVHAVDEHGHAREYQYSHHLITRYADRTGRGMSLEWNGSEATSRVIREYADGGSSELKLEYVEHLRLTVITDGLGGETYYYMDESGYPYRTVHPDGKEEWLFRDDYKNLTLHVHPDGTQESFAYDERDNMIEHVRADASIVRMQYDDKDQLVAITDPLGQVWQREYDAAGNMVRETDPLGHKTEYAYSPKGQPLAIKDAKGGSKKLAYTPAGQLASYTDCSGKTSSWAYDARGQLIGATDAAGNITAYQYGADGHLARIVQADGTAITLEHDAEGRLLAHTDALARTTRYSWDRAGRLSSRMDAAEQQLSYAYDPLDRLVTLTNENRDSYRFVYDAVGRLLEETDFSNQRTVYGYDAGNGRLTTVDEGGTRTTLAFDPAYRLIGRDAGKSRERFLYDPLGRLVQAKNRYSTARFWYDEVGNLEREQQLYSLFGLQRDYQWQHEYDELGNRIASVRPDGNRVDWLTYGSGHVHGMLWNGEEIASFERDDLHRETARTLGNRLSATTQYDALGRVLQQQLTGSTQLQRRYRYDPVGQLLGISDSRSGETNYRYDPVGRLLAAVSPHGSESFAFDPASNLVDSIRSDNTLPSNLPRITGNLLRDYAGTHFDYDARGNLMRKTRSGQTQTFEWDDFNRLVAANSEAGKTEYAYDTFGRRIAKKTAQGTTLFLWDGDVLASEHDGNTQRHYLFEANSFVPLAQIAQQAGEKHKAYYHVDHLGTPQLLTDDAGQIAWSAEYKAWGEAKAAISDAAKAAGIANPIRFQGQYADEETGLHYNHHRYYDPEIGRFVSKDPIGLLGGLNTHAYAPNPVEWVDVFGLAPGKKRPQGGWNYNNMPDIEGTQKHHIIPQAIYRENHPALQKAGIDVHDTKNIIYLPTCRGGHPTRTVHNGSHPGYSNTIRNRLNEIDEYGKDHEWSNAQYKEAVSQLMAQERASLRKGTTILNKNSVPPCPR